MSSSRSSLGLILVLLIAPALAGALRPEWRWATVEPVDAYAEFTLGGYSIFSPAAWWEVP